MTLEELLPTANYQALITHGWTWLEDGEKWWKVVPGKEYGKSLNAAATPNRHSYTGELTGGWSVSGSLELALEFAALAGIQSTPPPGMVLVPMDVIDRGLKSLKVMNATSYTSGGLCFLERDLKKAKEAALSQDTQNGAPSQESEVK